MSEYVYYIYKITNLINSKYYIGVRKQNVNKTDNYMGSGVAINNAYKKYGKENFTKEIIQYFDTHDELYEKEKQLVTPDLVNDPLCYNIALGGRGNIGFKHTKEAKEKIRLSSIGRNTDKVYTKETILKMSESHIGLKASNETKKKMSNARLGHKCSAKTLINMSNARKGRTFSDEAKHKMSKAKLGTKQQTVTCPHCGKVGGIAPMYVWHFDKCKQKLN